MKNNHFFITILLIIIVLTTFISCNKDPNPFVDFEQDITLVYGIINPMEQDHYVRIQKAFLTEGDAYQMATDEQANIYLDSLVVRVFVTEPNGSTPIYGMDWMLEKIYVNKPDTMGDFSWNGKYPVFHFHHAFDLSKIKDKIIHLEIVNQNSNKKITAQSNIITELSIKQPNGVNYKPGDRPYQFGLSYTAKESKILINPNKYSKRYNVYFDFVYENHFANGGKRLDTVTYNLGSIEYDGDPYNISGNNKTTDLIYNPSAFFPWLSEVIPTDPNVVARVPRYFNFYFWSCTLEMKAYLDVNSIQNGIIQDRPEYTNLTSSTGKSDVYGLFTCRFSRIANDMSVSQNMSIELENNLKNLHFHTTYP